ncbi:MFS transporter [Leucobacter komagatae]|uniref:MFS transporter n=1 Tax=Leucobacter komagatae TaxID=55969 RepID=UPI0009FBC1A2|nr:MFS transporter [Leucobacter komagatae]
MNSDELHLDPQAATSAKNNGPKQRAKRRAFLGAVTGHLIEWYDYGVYGFVAVFIGQAFFASESPVVNLISSFAVFALSFFVRPLGGLFFGPFSDRFGRKRSLLLVLILMAGSTFAIGILPTSESIGWLAPLLLVLVRCLQGFSAGGEVGTVAAFIAEYSGPKRRGLSTSWLMVTGVMGLILGGLVSNGLIFLMGSEAMQNGGWRIPFLVAGPLGLIALYIRMKLEDTPEFLQLVARGTTSKVPLREVMQWKRALALVFAAIALHASAFYLLLTFSSTFMSNTLEFESGTVLLFVFGSGTLAAAVMPFGGMITDRFGRKPFMLTVAILSIGAFLWFFLAAEGATPATFIGPILAIALLFGCYVSSTFALMTDLLPTHIRSTGIAIAFNLPIALFGGTAPMIATALIAATGDITSPMYFFAGTAVVAAAGLALLRNSDFERSAKESERVLTGPVPTEGEA